MELNKTQTMRDITDCIASEYGVTVEQVISRSREQPLPNVRQLAIYCVHSKLGKKTNLREVGKFFRRNHATVIYSIKTVQSLKETQSGYHEEVDRYFTMFGIHEKKATPMHNKKFMSKLTRYLLIFSETWVIKTTSHDAIVRNFVESHKF